MTALDEALAKEDGDTSSARGPTQANLLIDLTRSAKLFHVPDGTGFADLDINGHRETWPIRSDDVLAFYGDGAAVPPLAFCAIIKDMKALLHNA